jgi:DNA polymerase III subunit chi
MAASEVEFHTSVADPPLFAVRLLRKAYRLGARVLVTAPAARLQVVDRLLWTGDEGDFVPHALLATTAARVWQRSPFWLAERVEDAVAAAASATPSSLPSVLINLGAVATVSTPGNAGQDRHETAAATRFARLIEIVGVEPDEVAAGRERWRAYKAAGLSIRHFVAGGS